MVETYGKIERIMLKIVEGNAKNLAAVVAGHFGTLTTAESV